MKNFWIDQYSKRIKFHWMFSVGRAASYVGRTILLSPRLVEAANRPERDAKKGELITVTFQNVSKSDSELFSFLADAYYLKNPNFKNLFAYLRLVDSLSQPIETWGFDKIKIEDVSFFSDDIDVTFSYKDKEYRDFLRKIEIHT